MEKWKNNKEYPTYLISNMGRVMNKNTGRILKPTYDKDGYKRITLINKQGKGKKIRIHRIVAETYIPNPTHKPCIDHINAIRTDNRVENLKWVTRKENSNTTPTLHNLKESHTKHRNIHQYDYNGKLLLQVWPTIKDITTNIKGSHKSGIAATINGKKKSAAGFKWTTKPLNYNDYTLFVKYPNTITISQFFEKIAI